MFCKDNEGEYILLLDIEYVSAGKIICKKHFEPVLVRYFVLI